VLGRNTCNSNTQNSPWPGLGGSHHLPPYNILCASPWGPHPNGFLSRAMVNLVCPGCSWLVLAPKVFQLCTNHFVLVLCRSVWVNKACHFVLIPSWSSSTPLYPFIVLRTTKRAPISCFSVVFSLGLTFESLKELGVHHEEPKSHSRKYSFVAWPSCNRR
jgi:hypothetical protein